MGGASERLLRALIIGSVALVACNRTPEGDGADRVTVRLLDEWRSVEARARSMDRREGMRQADAYLTGVGLDALYALCADPPEDAESANALASLVTAKLELDPVPGHTLAAWLADGALSPICRARVLRIAQGTREDLSEEEQNAISDALLDASLASAGDSERRPDWEVSAAQFGRTDRVLARVRELLSSTDDASRVRGALLAGESRDPRVTNVLLETLGRVVRDPSGFTDSAGLIAQNAARLADVRALVALERLAIEGGHVGFAAAVPALGYVKHPRALEILLRAYGDSSLDPEAGADALQRADRQHLYNATRRLESYLKSALMRGNPDHAHIAYVLVDRASRHGPLVSPSEVVEALRTFRHAGAPGTSLEAVDATIARLTP